MSQPVTHRAAPLSFNQAAHVVLGFVSHLRSKPMHTSTPTLSCYLDGEVDLRAVAASIAEIVRRHDILRSAFPDPARPSRSDEQAIVAGLRGHDICAGGRLMQYVRDREECDGRSIVQVLDAADGPPDWLVAEMARPFDYAAPPLMRVIVCRLSERRYWMVCVFHHLVADRWSLGVMRREFGICYRRALGDKTVPEPAPLRLQYGDFAAAQWQRFGPTPSRDVQEYWRTYWLSRAQARITPDAFGPASGPIRRQDSLGSAYEILGLPGDIGSRLKRLSKQRHVTAFGIFIAAVALLCSAVARKRRVAVWTYYSNRTSVDLEALIGWCANGRLLCVEVVEEERVSDLLGRVRAAVSEAQARQDVPVQAIWRWLAESNGPDPLLDDFVSLDMVVNTAPESICGMTISPALVSRVRQARRSSLDFCVAEERSTDGTSALTLGCLYDTDKLDRPSAIHLLNLLKDLVTSISDDAEQLVSSVLSRRAT